MIVYKIPTSINEVSHLRPDLELFCDSETEKFYVNTRLIQVYQPKVDSIVYILDTDIIDEAIIIDWLKEMWTIWHKASYDLGTMNFVPRKLDDTLYLTRMAFPEWQEYALDKVVTKLGYDYLYEGLEKKEKQKAGFMKGAYLSHTQLRYAATDVVALALIWEHPLVQKARDITAYKVDILNLGYAVQYQQNGLDVNRAFVRKEIDLCSEKIDTNEIALNGLNSNSSKQCKAIFGTENTNKNTLIHLIAEGNALAKVVFDQRRLLKRRTMLESYNFPKVFTKYDVAGATTGRFTAAGGDLERGINAQQITRNLQYMFVPEDPEYCIVKVDYPTLELRLACTIFNEPTMYQRLLDGIDLHRATAMDITGKSEITKAERQNAKAVNFGFVFGMGWEAFIEYAFVEYNVIFTPKEAQIARAKYFQTYPNFAKYHAMVWNAVQRKNYIYTTPLGRRVKPRTGTDGINGPVQGGGGETTKLSIHYSVKEQPTILKYINNVVHDAIYVKCKRSEARDMGMFLCQSMHKGWTEISKTKLFNFKDIPMPLEYEIVGNKE